MVSPNNNNTGWHSAIRTSLGAFQEAALEFEVLDDATAAWQWWNSAAPQHVVVVEPKKDDLAKALQHFLHVLACAATARPAAALTLVEVLAGGLAQFVEVQVGGDTLAHNRHTLLDQALRISQQSAHESVRVVALAVLRGFVHAWNRQTSSSNASKWLSDCYDRVSQALLPRFTDVSAAVRQAAIHTASIVLEAETDDPDLRQALIWSLQHDTSVTNRNRALRGLQRAGSVDAVLARLRDAKPTVRTAAWQALQTVPPHEWTAAERAGLVETGLATAKNNSNNNNNNAGSNDPSTHQAAAAMICQGWMKAYQYQPMELLKALDVIAHEPAAALLIPVLRRAAGCTVGHSEAETDLLQALSEPEQRAFIQGVQAADRSVQFEALSAADTNPEQWLWARVVQATPDMDVLSRALTSTAQKLMESLTAATADAENNNSSNISEDAATEDILVFTCQQILQMATESAESMEEGGRQILSNTLKGLLSSVVTPDDLVEPCLQTLLAISAARNPLQAVDQVIQEVDRLCHALGPDLQTQHQFRLLTIASLALEHAPLAELVSQSEILATWTNHHVQPLLTQPSPDPWIPAAAMDCWGRLGLFCGCTSTNTTDNGSNSLLQSTFLPALLPCLQSSALCAPALVAGVDWALLDPTLLSPQDDSDNNSDVARMIVERLSAWLLGEEANDNDDNDEDSNHTLGQQCLAAELCAKLLVAGRVERPDWVAQLVHWMLQPPTKADDDDDNDENDICDDQLSGLPELGNPGRLLQVLAQFVRAVHPTQLASCTLPLLQQQVGRRVRGRRPAAKHWTQRLDCLVQHAPSKDQGWTIAHDLAQFLATESANAKKMTKATLRSLTQYLSHLVQDLVADGPEEDGSSDPKTMSDTQPATDKASTSEQDDIPQDGDDEKEEQEASPLAVRKQLQSLLSELTLCTEDAAALEHIQEAVDTLGTRDDDDEKSASSSSSDEESSESMSDNEELVSDNDEASSIAANQENNPPPSTGKQQQQTSSSRRERRTSLGTVNA